MPRFLQPPENISDHGYIGDTDDEGGCQFVTGQDVSDGGFFYCEYSIARHVYKDQEEYELTLRALPPVMSADQVPRSAAQEARRVMRQNESSEAAVAFCAHADATLALVRKKDAAYGGAWQAQGYMGNLARIMSKTARLENMLWRDQFDPPAVQGAEYSAQADMDSETVLDTLHDLMALAAFMASNFEEGNRWGQ